MNVQASVREKKGGRREHVNEYHVGSRSCRAADAGGREHAGERAEPPEHRAEPGSAYRGESGSGSGQRSFGRDGGATREADSGGDACESDSPDVAAAGGSRSRGGFLVCVRGWSDGEVCVLPFPIRWNHQTRKKIEERFSSKKIEIAKKTRHDFFLREDEQNEQTPISASSENQLLSEACESGVAQASTM